jgi:hypothetical protein
MGPRPADGAIGRRKGGNCVGKRRKERGGVLLVHHGARMRPLPDAEIGDRVKKRIGPLVAEEEGEALVLSGTDELGSALVEIAAEEIVRDDGGHGRS